MQISRMGLAQDECYKNLAVLLVSMPHLQLQSSDGSWYNEVKMRKRSLEDET